MKAIFLFFVAALIHQSYGQAMTKLMIVGGDGNPYQVQTLDLSGQLQTCPTLAPVLIEEAGVGVFINGQAMVCAGENDGQDCYVYNNVTKEWSVAATPTIKAYYRGSVLLSNDEWWLVGGVNLTYSFPDTELFMPSSNNFQMTPPMPRGIKWPVALSYDPNTVYVTAGNPASTEVFAYDRTTSTWSTLTNLPTEKNTAFAGLVTRASGDRELVVTGGLNDTTTEVYSFSTSTWAPGRDLPLPVFLGSSVQFGNTFLVVGGEYQSGSEEFLSDMIFEYDPETGDFNERPERLPIAVSEAAAFLVPDDYIQCS